jgi:AcrR family transcriptional regulator
MAYDVTKVVNGRSYRYRVRSERDAVTGKFRNRWTYLGRADAAGVISPTRERRNARTALLDALERLLLTNDPDAVTAAAVSTEAGVAHGTFYRYFRNKSEAIVALFERLGASRSADFEMLDAVPAALPEARAALRAWMSGRFRAKDKHVDLLRVFDSLWAREELLDAHRRARRASFNERLRAYLTTIDERGFARIADPAASASVLAAMLVGIFRETILTGPLDEARIAAAVDLIERAVFGASVV